MRGLSRHTWRHETSQRLQAVKMLFRHMGKVPVCDGSFVGSVKLYLEAGEDNLSNDGELPHDGSFWERKCDDSAHLVLLHVRQTRVTSAVGSGPPRTRTMT